MTTTQMTIARALKAANRTEGNLNTVSKRAEQNVSWQADREQEFNFDQLMTQRQELVDELLGLRSAIDLANATTTIEFEGQQMALARAIRLVLELAGQISFYQKLNLVYGEQRQSTGRHLPQTYEPEMETVEFASALREPERVSKIDQLQQRLDELNKAIKPSGQPG